MCRAYQVGWLYLVVWVWFKSRGRVVLIRKHKLCKKPGGLTHSALSWLPWDRYGSDSQRLDCHGIAWTVMVFFA
ncbi:hypothetical protein RSAG8_09209, partial [Rhizoctonia solani AG-8 WAC10335]